jgi:CDP-glycerol glycerophosphotransferase
VSADSASIVTKGMKAASVVLRSGLARLRMPQALYPTPSGWVSELRSFRWLDDDRFEVTGWAYDRAVDYTGTKPEIQVWAELPSTIPRFVALETRVTVSPEVNQPFNGAVGEVDYSGTCFVAVGSIAQLEPAGVNAEWVIRVGVAAPGSQVQGIFKKRYVLGSAEYLTSRRGTGASVVPRWSGKSGLSIVIRDVLPTATSIEYSPADGRVRITVVAAEPVSAAALVSAQGREPLEVHTGPDCVVVSGVLPAVTSDAWASAGADVWDNPLPGELDAANCLPWLLSRVVARVGGEEQPVLIGSGALVEDHPTLLEAGPDGELRLISSELAIVVTDVQFGGGDDPKLTVKGRHRGDLSGVRFELANGRDSRPGELVHDGESFTVVVPFLQSKWHLPALPPQIGRITLQAKTADGLAVPVRCTPRVVELAPTSILNRWFRLYYSFTAGKVLTPRLEIPVTDDEIGTFNQARIQRQYLSGEWPIIDRMYFESFYGRQCGCSPLALREEMAAKHPRVPRVWAVRDLSVAVPEGDEAVVDATTGWWRARAESRWLVVNDWLRARYAHREGQTVLQTWHGTMYKKVGLDRGEQLDAEEKEFMLGERNKWDLLLSQNPHSTRVFRESYLSNPPIYEEGYPRNDLLVNGDGGPIRDVLGIRADQTVILYAPTWRDDRTELVDYLDLDRLAADLGDDYALLLRAHSRVIRVGSAAKVGKGVIDVSTYPNTTDLLLIADIMITDYSSVMFDYAVTGRPMIFFTPDMDQYRDQLRGVYLDLEKVGPGPVVSTQADVLTAIREIDQIAATFAARYAQWQADYTPWDDGGSSERVLVRYLQDAPPADLQILN